MMISHARRGKFAEGWMDLHLQRLAVERWAFIQKTAPETGADRQGRRVFSRSGPPDYMGTVGPAIPGAAGRSVVFDLKSVTAAGETHWDWRKSASKDRQLRDLTLHGEHGALAGLLVLWVPPALSTYYVVWIPWWKLPVVAKGTWAPDVLRMNGCAGVHWNDGDPGWLGAALAYDEAWREEHAGKNARGG